MSCHVGSGRRALGQSCPNVGDEERLISILAGTAVGLIGYQMQSLRRLIFLGTGAGLIYRGVTGQCGLYKTLGIDTTRDRSTEFRFGVPAKQGVKVELSMIVDRPPAELYAFWKNLDNFPRLFAHLKEVTPSKEGFSHWVAYGPFGSTVEWDAEIFNERENEMIAWCSLPGSQIETAGSVHFKSFADGRATELTVSMSYRPPMGKTGDRIASWFGFDLEQVLMDDLERAQQVLEGEPKQSPADIPVAV